MSTLSANQIKRGFEEMRQSIEVRNSMHIDRNKQKSSFHDQRQNGLMTEDGDRMPHRNREVTLTYEGDELQQIKMDIQVDLKAETLEYGEDDNNQDFVNNKKGESDEHAISLKTLSRRFNTDIQCGLTQKQAEISLQQYGPNKLTEKKRTPAWVKFMHEISNGFAIMMWAGQALCWIAYGLDTTDPSNYYLAIIIIAVVLLTGVITFKQNQTSEALMDSFKNILPQRCRVVRDGIEKEIEAIEVTIGDIVRVKAGQKIPADIRIIMSDEMKVDNSALTGESEPQLRVTDCTHPKNVLETGNVAFFGTLCKEGVGEGVVIKVGDSTMLGLIADSVGQEKKERSPLRIQLDKFVIMIAIIAIGLGIIFFLLAAFVAEYPVIFCILLGIGILVSNVPEGLLGCVTVALAVTAKELHRKQVLVKNLESVETLGSTSCICSDKTGTLTKNLMSVHHMWFNDQNIRTINFRDVKDKGALEYQPEEPGFKDLHQSAIIASGAKFDKSNIKDLDTLDYMTCPVLGDATETGMVRFFQQIEDIELTRSRYHVPTNSKNQKAIMPFNSQYKFALTIVEQKTSDSDYCIYMKGAPEKIWACCSGISIRSERRSKTKEWSDKFDAVNLTFGKQGERVLGFSKYHLPREQFPIGFDFMTSNPEKFNFPIDNFTFIGLISLIDPPKDSVPQAVLECRSAGIKVIMVTGDQPPTAAAIARQVNIFPKHIKTVDDIMEEKGISWEEASKICEAIVVHGDRITEANKRDTLAAEDELLKAGKDISKLNRTDCNKTLRSWVTKRYCVFARTTPVQKLLIVQACQDEGFICAATGDGVNDSPAIQRADIGISMNISGSEVTKDAADMILLDDDFSSIVNGVEEGRKIFDNIQKTTVYMLASNIPELVPFLAFIAFRIPLPITNIFMIFIQVGTDILPSISLGYEQAEIDVMTRRPRSKHQNLVSIKVITHAYALMGLIASGGGFNSYYITMNHFGFPIKSLFGLSTVEGYTVPSSQAGVVQHLKENADRMISSTSSVYYNEGIMTTEGLQGDCVADMERIEILGSLSKLINNEIVFKDKVEWITVEDGNVDLRKSMVFCDDKAEEGQQYWRSLIEYSYCDVDDSINYSPFTEQTACYTAEALKYGQSAWTIGIVVFQMSNVVMLKSKKTSFTTTPYNAVTIYGIILEMCLCVIITQVPGIRDFFGGRPLSFWQYGWSAVPWSIGVMVWEETRKLLCRNFLWFEKHVLW